MKIAILTDSSSGLTNHEIADLFVLPLPIITSSDEIIADDISDFANQNKILQEIATRKLKTSFINPGILEIEINKILETYDYVVFLPIAYNLSSQYNNSLVLLKQKHLHDKLTIVKHYFTGIQLGKFIISLAPKLCNINDIKSIDFSSLVTAWADKSLLMVIPGSISNLASSGRVSNLVSLFLDKKEIKIGIFWRVKSKKIISKNYQKLVRKYLKQVNKQFDLNNCEIYIAHTSLCQPVILDLFQNQLGEQSNIRLTQLPTVFAVHGGLDTIGLVIFKK